MRRIITERNSVYKAQTKKILAKEVFTVESPTDIVYNIGGLKLYKGK